MRYMRYINAYNAWDKWDEKLFKKNETNLCNIWNFEKDLDTFNIYQNYYYKENKISCILYISYSHIFQKLQSDL